jgi:SNF2 family DNA or RNA helicase
MTAGIGPLSGAQVDTPPWPVEADPPAPSRAEPVSPAAPAAKHAPAEAIQGAPRPLYRSPWAHVPDFQVRFVARAFVARFALVIADAGLGKSHIGLMMAALGFEEGETDLVLVVAEQNKIREWRDDFAACTGLTHAIYHGTGRQKKLASPPQVLITTYETVRNDVVVFSKPRGGGSKSPGPLMQALADRRVTVIYDEASKIRNRSSTLYKAHYWMAVQLRKQAGTRILGMTATPIERDWEDAFSELRLVTPAMPTVAEFEKRMVRFRDDYQKPHWRPEGIPWLTGLCQPWILRKRKTDPDVAGQFPEKTERVRTIPLAPEQRKFYELVRGLSRDEHDNWVETPGLWTVLCQVAGAPAAILGGKSRLARLLEEMFGDGYIRDLPSAKADRLEEDLELLVNGQGAKVAVFTMWAHSVLPVLERRLRAAGHALFVIEGSMTSAAQHEVRQAFRQWPDPAVLLTSDAGSRGVNIPEAAYVIEYDGTTHARHVQRMDRAHRMGTGTDGQGRRRLLTCWTYIAEGTVEEGVAESRLERNAQADAFLGDGVDERYITAADRRAMIEAGRKLARKR